LSLPLPVKQDMVDLDKPGDWENMKDEYNVLSLFPAGHIMARLRPLFHDNICCSKDIGRLKDGAEVMTAGLVIRRQRPRGKVVFITLEDEFGHIPLMVFPQVYERQELKFKSPFLIVKGTLNRREGTCNLVVNQVKPFSALENIPQSKDWR
jgi:error-prone DNA polymerase